MELVLAQTEPLRPFPNWSADGGRKAVQVLWRRWSGSAESEARLPEAESTPGTVASLRRSKAPTITRIRLSLYKLCVVCAATQYLLLGPLLYTTKSVLHFQYSFPLLPARPPPAFISTTSTMSPPHLKSLVPPKECSSLLPTLDPDADVLASLLHDMSTVGPVKPC